MGYWGCVSWEIRRGLLIVFENDVALRSYRLFRKLGIFRFVLNKILFGCSVWLGSDVKCFLAFLIDKKRAGCSMIPGAQHLISSGGAKQMKIFLKKMSPIMVGRRRKFWFLEALKTTHGRLEIDTIIKISFRDFLDFLKNKKK